METKSNNKDQKQTFNTIMISTIKKLKKATPTLVLVGALVAYGYYNSLQIHPLQIPQECKIVYSNNGQPISKIDAKSFQEQNKKGLVKKLPKEFGLECDCEDDFRKLNVFRENSNNIHFTIRNNPVWVTIYYDTKTDGILNYVTKCGLEASPTPKDREKFELMKEFLPKIYNNQK